MQTTAPFISIILPCRNENRNIELCVRSILGQDSPLGGFEVIVADGMSNDGTREILQLLAVNDERLRIIDNPGCIVSTGLNAAIAAAGGTVIIRMDAHTEYASDYIKQCVAVLQETEAANVGGPWVAKGNGLIGQTIAAAFQSPFVVGGARAHNPGYEGVVDTVYLGCWPRETFDRIGLFDEELVRNQDDEFNLRLTRNSGKIWQSPRIKSWYQPRESLMALFKQYMQYGYWKVRVIQKHKIPGSVRQLIPGAFVFLLIILPLFSLLWTYAIVAWAGLIVIYAVSSLAASLLIAYRHGYRIFPLLPFVIFLYHFGYGYGFLRGILDFVIFRCKPRVTFSTLTRNTSG